jgi:hypothetical protein
MGGELQYLLVLEGFVKSKNIVTPAKAGVQNTLK